MSKGVEYALRYVLALTNILLVDRVHKSSSNHHDGGEDTGGRPRRNWLAHGRLRH